MGQWRNRAGDSVAQVLARWGSRVESLARYRWALPVLAGIWCMGNPPTMFGDPIRFARAGAQLWHGDLSSIYADSWMQAGPFELLAGFALLPRDDQHRARYVILSEHDLPVTLFVLGAVITVAVMLAVRLVRWAAPGLDPSPGLEALAGLAVVVSALPSRVWPGGHLAQLAVPFVWIAAGALILRGRTTFAAALIGLSAGWEPWGVLAAGMLVTSERKMRDGGTLAAAAVAPYLPFVLTGHFEMFGLEWPVAPGSLVHLIDPGATAFSWWMRLVQGAAAITAGALVARRPGRRENMVWLAPMAVVATRVALDPLTLSHYWTPLCVTGVLGLGLRRAGDSTTALAGTLLLAYLPPFFLWPMVAWPPYYVLLVPILLLVAGQTLITPRDHPPSAGTPRAGPPEPRRPARPTAPGRLLRAGAPSFRAAPTDSTR